MAIGAKGRTKGLEADLYRAMVESSDDAIISKDRDGIIRSWNPAAARLYGYTDEEAIGSPISILIPEHRAGEERRILDRVLGGERVEHYETERVRKSGEQIVISLTVSPVRDENGAVALASVIARDVTSRRRSDELAGRLQELTAALSQEITPERAVEVLLEQAVAGFEADAGTLGLLDPEQAEVELVGSVGHRESGLAGWSRFPLDAEVPMSAAIRQREAVWTTSADELRRRFPPLADAEVHFASLAVVPLVVESVPIGALALSFSAERSFDAQERSFLLAAAQQAAGTLARARLYEAQRLTAERLAFLAEASEVLSQSLDPDAALERLAEIAVDRVADWCGIEMIEEDGGLRSVAVAHKDPDKVRLAVELRRRYPFDSDGFEGVPAVLRTGRAELYPVISDEMLAERARDGEHLRLMRELGLVSAMIVPLVARGRTFGALTLVAAESGRRYGDEDLELAEDLARRAALAIDNSLLFYREHEAAVTLQRSLLPESLPEIEGLEFAARYDPAAPGLEVGGDWYEVVERPDRTIGLTIGDVAGRGIGAASVMGRVRPALRAYVADGHSPSAALRRLDGLMKESDSPQMVTVFHLHFDPRSRRAEYVRAGHPPALLRRPDGEVEVLGGSGAPPLGILEGVELESHSVEIRPGSLVLLYTDGLIERRDKSLDQGLARLREEVARGPAGAKECLEALAAAFRADAVPDDVAMLAMAT